MYQKRFFPSSSSHSLSLSSSCRVFYWKLLFFLSVVFNGSLHTVFFSVRHTLASIMYVRNVAELEKEWRKADSLLWGCEAHTCAFCCTPWKLTNMEHGYMMVVDSEETINEARKLTVTIRLDFGNRKRFPGNFKLLIFLCACELCCESPSSDFNEWIACKITRLVSLNHVHEQTCVCQK